ncbi:MAG: ABC transporter permease [Firmicutes bacterium]|nr:ABC transporter permease [Bacillota bacterium]
MSKEVEMNLDGSYERTAGVQGFFKRISRVQGLSAIFPLVVLVIFLTLTTDAFLTKANLMNVLRQAAVYAIMATGMTFVLLTGGVDLSQGSVLAFSCVVCAMTLNATGMVWLSILVTLLAGALVGYLNGTIVAYVKLPPFIVTLGSMYIVRGVTLHMTGSRQVSIRGFESLTAMGQGFFLDIPIPVYIFLVVGVLAQLFLTYTSTGRQIFAVGSNRVTARLSGVKVEKIITLVYTLSAVCVSLAGIVYLARLTAAQPTTGEGYEMEAIAAAVVGGTSQAGGEGGVLGTLIGAVIIAVIRNGLVLLGVGSYFTKIVVGAIIVVAVALDVTRRRLRANR